MKNLLKRIAAALLHNPYEQAVIEADAEHRYIVRCVRHNRVPY